MTNKDKNMAGSHEEEKEMAFLASLPRTSPYRVPDGYFDDLQIRINQTIFLDGLIQRDESGFKVPQNYFEELSNQIESKIAVEELKQLALHDGFKTPPNYFNQLQNQIISKTSGATSKTKVVKLWHREAMKYVSAACFFVVIASGLYLKQQQRVKLIASIELENEHKLYDIDESVIFEHIQESQSAGTSATPAEMENYILDNFSSSDIANNL
jgi:hypothetical protein